jgi:hypothetical protein
MELLKKNSKNRNYSKNFQLSVGKTKTRNTNYSTEKIHENLANIFLIPEKANFVSKTNTNNGNGVLEL